MRLVGLAHAAELVDEVHVPRRPAELAVGGRLQADVLLHAHDVADGVVLDGPQLVGATADRRRARSRASQQALGAQQAADVIGAERRTRDRGHRAGERTVAPVSRELRTQVGIVGAGPAGLVLSHLLAARGIESVVLEDRSRDYVEQRVRAGVLEHPTVELLRRLGLAERLDREALVHHGVQIAVDGHRHRIDFTRADRQVRSPSTASRRS